MSVPESRINIPRSTLLIASCLGPVGVGVSVGVKKIGIEESKNIGRTHENADIGKRKS